MEPSDSTTSVLRCIVADDHPAIVDAIARFMADVVDIELAGSARDGEQALTLVEQERPDVAVLDVRMPRVDGIEVARRLHDGGSSTASILFTGFPERSLVLEALDVGARGFLAKEAPLDSLMDAIRAVAAGKTYVDPTLADVITGSQVAERLPELTKREREVLRLLADGMRDEQVAGTLAISPHTVRTHVQHVMAKLEADTRTQAVAHALRLSLIV